MRVGIKQRQKIWGEFFAGLEDLEIAFEATSGYECFYEVLEGQGHKVKLAHSLKTRMIVEAKINNDKIVRKFLWICLGGGLLPTSYVPLKKIRELRNHNLKYFMQKHE